MLYTECISTFEELKESSWSGAMYTLGKIEDADKGEALMEFLDAYFSGFEMPPSRTEINDFLWFDSDFIFEELGLDYEGNPKGEE